MAKQRFITDFTEGNVPKQLLRFATPLLLANLLQAVYNMADMVIVGRVMGSVGLSAVSVGGDVSGFLTFLAMGFSNAGQVIISQYIGAGQRKKVGGFVGTMFTFLTACSLVLSVICLIFRQGILGLMNTPAASWDEALAYSTVCIAGLFFIYGYNMVSAVLRGMGDSRHPFIFIALAAVMNIVLDIVLVWGLQMGAMGAAIATVFSQGFSFVTCSIFLWRSRHEMDFEVSFQDFLHPKMEYLSSLTKLGIPMAIKSASIHFSKLFVNSWINSYGVAVSAMAGIVNKLGSICNLISNSVNAAGSSMVGQNVGAQKYERVPRIMTTCFCFTLCSSALMALAVYLFPELVFGIFTDEAAVMAIAMEWLPVSVVLFLGSACRSPMNALINGSGNHKVNFATAILDGIVMRIGLGVLLGLVLHMDYIGFWLGDALAGYTPFFIGLVYYFTGSWKTRKYVIKEEKASS
ncbi:MAG: MATE family efflux transporter [Clostridia bacterium]|nr:MATE family efflux transporter [Clostridia bacterium]